MRTLKYFPLVIAALLMTGCWTVSVNPLYTVNDLVYEGQLVGVWGTPETSEETWTFEQGDDHSYRLIVREHGAILDSTGNYEDGFRLVDTIDTQKDGLFEAHLCRLNGLLFMDLFPEEPDFGNSYFKSHIIPVHSFFRISMEDDNLKITALDAEWLEDGLESGTLDIRHERRDDMVVLTASTEELQYFVVTYADEAFTDLSESRRLR